MARGRHAIDLRGVRFGRLVVLGAAARRGSSGMVRWECICDCGNHSIQRSDDLRRKKVVSCGCVRSELRRVGMQEFNARRLTQVLP